MLIVVICFHRDSFFKGLTLLYEKHDDDQEMMETYLKIRKEKKIVKNILWDLCRNVYFAYF